MKDDKTIISLTQVRAMMLMLAQKHKCGVCDITNAQVHAEMGGSNGTIGALVRLVKMEEISAKAYDRKNISAQLKSALIEEIERFADNAREVAAEQLEAVDQLNEELCTKIDDAEKRILELDAALKAQQKKDDQEIGHLKEELAKATEKITTYEEALKEQKESLAAGQKALAEKGDEITNLNRKIGSLEGELKSVQQDASDARRQLNEAANDMALAERRGDLAEKEVAHQAESIRLLREQGGRLEEEVNGLKRSVRELTALNEALHQKLEEANLRHIDDLRTARQIAAGEDAAGSPLGNGDKTVESGEKRGKTKKSP